MTTLKCPVKVMTMTQKKPIHKPWQPQSILITSVEVEDSIAFANYIGWYFAASPLNAAFVTMLAIDKATHEDPFDN